MDETSLCWVASFLSDRTSEVVLRHLTPDGYIINIFSDPRGVNCGVPQGSVLGPLLFNTYSNSLFSHVLSGLLVVYADDTNHIVRGKNFQNMLDLAKIGLQQMQHWSQQHQLALNDKKTTFLQFHTKQKQITITPLIKLNNNTITPSSNTKFLGLNIADDLDW